MERYDRGIHIADFRISEMLLKQVDGTYLNHLSQMPQQRVYSFPAINRIVLLSHLLIYFGILFFQTGAV